MDDHTVTLTHRRRGQDITVAMHYFTVGNVPQWDFVEALDEYGNPALLTWPEHLALLDRASAGEDETGR